MLKLLWPLLIINLRIPGLIWQGTVYFAPLLLPYLETLDELRAGCHARRRWPIFRAKFEARRHKLFHIFYFSQSDTVLGILNPISWIFKAISNDKSCLISVYFWLTYIGVRTVTFFEPAESWLVNSNFTSVVCKTILCVKWMMVPSILCTKNANNPKVSQSFLVLDYFNFLSHWSLAKILVTFFYPEFLVLLHHLKSKCFLFLQVLNRPNAAGDRSIANDSSSASLGVAVGVTIGVILIVLLVGTLIYRRLNAR